jgi:hypothetical protein
MKRQSKAHPIIHHIRDHRSELVRKIRLLPNVRGTMIGLRLQKGDTTDEVCISVLVDSKKTLDELPKDARIPRSIRVGGKTIPVDVVKIGAMRMQSNAFPDPGPIGISVETSTGTMGAFCVSPNGVFGMTCAHVLGTTGASPSGAQIVKGWSSIMKTWIPMGRTLFSVSGPGSGVHGDFGFADAGLTTLEHPELIARAHSARPISVSSCNLGTIVHGDGAVCGVRHGQVVGIEKALDDSWADAVIQVSEPGTFSGDSGMLWKDGNGSAAAIHAFGESNGEGAGSRLTTAMYASRAAIKLGVKLLNVPD